MMGELTGSPMGNSLDAMARMSSACCLATMLMTPGLWIAKGSMSLKFDHIRTLPNLPLFSFLEFEDMNDTFAHNITNTVYFLTLATLGLSAVFADRRTLMLQNIFLAILLVLDQLRFQTWIYNFMSITLAVSLVGKRRSSSEKEREWNEYVALFVCRTVASCVWTYSGALKFNPEYPPGDFNFMMYELPGRLPKFYFFLLAYISGFIEASIGLLLLLINFYSFFTVDASDSLGKPRSSTVSAVSGLVKQIIWWGMPRSAIVMHVMIISRLLDAGYELSVIPWNMAFISYAYNGFCTSENPTWKRPSAYIQQKKRNLFKSLSWNSFFVTAVVLLYFCIPPFCFANISDSYVSFSMYTTNDPVWVLSVPTRLQLSSNQFPNKAWTGSVPIQMRQYSCTLVVCSTCNGVSDTGEAYEQSITTNHEWGFHDTGASIYPAIHTYRYLSKRICEAANSHPDIRFIFLDKFIIPYSSKRNATEYRCVNGNIEPINTNMCKEPEHRSLRT